MFLALSVILHTAVILCTWTTLSHPTLCVLSSSASLSVRRSQTYMQISHFAAYYMPKGLICDVVTLSRMIMHATTEILKYYPPIGSNPQRAKIMIQHSKQCLYYFFFFVLAVLTSLLVPYPPTLYPACFVYGLS